MLKNPFNGSSYAVHDCKIPFLCHDSSIKFRLKVLLVNIRSPVSPTHPAKRIGVEFFSYYSYGYINGFDLRLFIQLDEYFAGRAYNKTAAVAPVRMIYNDYVNFIFSGSALGNVFIMSLFQVISMMRNTCQRVHYL